MEPDVALDWMSSIQKKPFRTRLFKLHLDSETAFEIIHKVATKSQEGQRDAVVRRSLQRPII